MLEKTLESPLDCKEIQPVHPKGGQSWVFIGRTDAEAETPVLWPPHVKSWLIWKDPDAGKYWGQEEKGRTRGWDGWMASPTQWTWVWVNSGNWWWTRRPAVLQSMGSQRVTHDWVTELNWVDQGFLPYIQRGSSLQFSHPTSIHQVHIRHEALLWTLQVKWCMRKTRPIQVGSLELGRDKSQDRRARRKWYLLTSERLNWNILCTTEREF